MILFSLSQAANHVVPMCKQNSLKSGWNAEAETLKLNSMVSHRKWIENGRPCNGAIHDDKANAKNLYKSMIKKNQLSDSSTISDSLHGSLSNKNKFFFWKIWNKKFGMTSTVSKSIDGITMKMSLSQTLQNISQKVKEVLQV